MTTIFICKECNQEFSCAENLSKHVKHHGIDNKQYYDKWFKSLDENLCKECGNETKFNGIQRGYAIYCNRICSDKGNVKNKAKKFIKIKEQRKIDYNKIKESFKFECLECGDKFETSLKLQRHIISKYTTYIYYNKWHKKTGEGECEICNEPTEFYNIKAGYKQCCSDKCSNQLRHENGIKTNLEKYGVKNPFESKEVQNKIRETFIKNYGVDNNMKSEKGREEYKKAMNKKYGVDWPLQDKKILDKNQKSAKTLKQYKDTKLWYQGSYEKEFLDLYLDKYPDMERGPSLKYKFKNNDKVYHSDFYIPSLNLVVEIKSSWTLNVDTEINEKKKATISNGFKYLMILDKNYEEFNFIILIL